MKHVDKHQIGNRLPQKRTFAIDKLECSSRRGHYHLVIAHQQTNRPVTAAPEVRKDP